VDRWMFMWTFICLSPETRNEGIGPFPLSALICLSHMYCDSASASPNFQVGVSLLSRFECSVLILIQQQYHTALREPHISLWFVYRQCWLSSPVNRSTLNLYKKVPHCGPAFRSNPPSSQGMYPRLLQIAGKYVPISFWTLSLTVEGTFYLLLVIVRFYVCRCLS